MFAWSKLTRAHKQLTSVLNVYAAEGTTMLKRTQQRTHCTQNARLIIFRSEAAIERTTQACSPPFYACIFLFLSTALFFFRFYSIRLHAFSTQSGMSYIQHVCVV